MALFKRTSKELSQESPSDILRAKDAVPRVRIRMQGTVLRVKAKPAAGLPTLIVTLGDDQGRVQAHWTGRRSVPGVTLGATLIIEGVATPTVDGLVFLNPLCETVATH